jgi:hypothetical protein
MIHPRLLTLYRYETMRNTTRHLVSIAAILGIISVSYAANAEHPAAAKIRAEKEASARMEACKIQMGCGGQKKNSEAYEACLITCAKQEQAIKQKAVRK